MDVFLHGGRDSGHGFRIRPAKNTPRRIEAAYREREIAELQQYRDYAGDGEIISETAVCEGLRSPAASTEGPGIQPGFIQLDLTGGWLQHEQKAFEASSTPGFARERAG
jgi:hypothetical protein